MSSSSSKHSDTSQNVVAIILIALGALFLLQSFDLLNFGHALASWWPVILLLVGFSKIKGSDKRAGTVIFALGIIFLSGTLDIINWISIFRFWPLILVFIGFSMLYKHRQGGPRHFFSQSTATGDDFVTANAIFGHIDHAISSANFKGGDILALFGGVTVDLRNATLSPEGCVLNCTSLFGGIDVYVPDNVSVRVTGTPIFGGIDNKVSTITSTEEKTSEIVLRCTVAFGGIDISR
ncbi:MAG: cell wall-active antibiotics response protein [FCB group bacterium]|nr:cell wall-active antibiotics response protein [FCB group bacterium]